jgi:hypothetical protein
VHFHGGLETSRAGTRGLFSATDISDCVFDALVCRGVVFYSRTREKRGILHACLRIKKSASHIMRVIHSFHNFRKFMMRFNEDC